jgi:hypothetical protein
MNLLNILYVPDLSVNLLSGNALCEKGLHNSFNKLALYMHDKKGRLILKTIKQGGIYIVNRIALNLEQSAFPTTVMNINSNAVNTGCIPANNTAGVHQEGVHRTTSVVRQSPEISVQSDPDFKSSVSDPSPNLMSNGQLPSGRSFYQLWHRRFAHMGEGKLKSLNRVTTL